jgi:hypothetical protein
MLVTFQLSLKETVMSAYFIADYNTNLQPWMIRHTLKECGVSYTMHTTDRGRDIMTLDNGKTIQQSNHPLSGWDKYQVDAIRKLAGV